MAVICSLLVGARLGGAPPPAVTLANTEVRSITSTSIGQTYEVMISLPEGYATSTQTYPVLYVLDGWHFPLMAFLANNSIYSGKLPPLIIVNVSHGAVNVMNLRQRDFTPTPIAGNSYSGGAPKFLAFLEQEFELSKVLPFFESFAALKPAGAEYRYTVYAGENHNSVRPYSFSSGLAWVYRDWKK